MISQQQREQILEAINKLNKSHAKHILGIVYQDETVSFIHKNTPETKIPSQSILDLFTEVEKLFIFPDQNLNLLRYLPDDIIQTCKVNFLTEKIGNLIQRYTSVEPVYHVSIKLAMLATSQPQVEQDVYKLFSKLQQQGVIFDWELPFGDDSIEGSFELQKLNYKSGDTFFNIVPFESKS